MPAVLIAALGFIGIAILLALTTNFLTWLSKKPKRALKIVYGATGNFKFFQPATEKLEEEKWKQ